jgi:ubiquinone/menaquinone biosynthesis C-methylase UbiE
MRTIALQRDFHKQKFQASLVDLSLDALLFARKYSTKNKISVNLILADGCRLPFSDETFDIVWNDGVNEHFKGKARYEIFREMSRVCKAKGHVIVIVPNAFNLPYRITKKVLEMKKRWTYGFEKPFTLFELKEKMKRAGITPIKAGGAGVIGSFLAFTQLIPTRTSKTQQKKKRKSDNHVFLKQIFVFVENTLETLFGSLFAKDIAVRGSNRASQMCLNENT